MRWYFEVLKKYAVFSGRARRAEYWWFVLFYLIIYAVLALIDGLMGTFSVDAGLGLLSGIYMFAVLLPALGVEVRRLHDIGRTGWWVLFNAVPVVGPIVILVFNVTDGESGSNQYGPDPKVTEA